MSSFLQKHSYLLVALGLIFAPIGLIISLAGLFAHGESGPGNYGIAHVGVAIAYFFGFILFVGLISSLIKSIKERKSFLVVFFSIIVGLFFWVVLRFDVLNFLQFLLS